MFNWRKCFKIKYFCSNLFQIIS